MSLRVDITDRAHRQLDAIADWWAENRSPEQAERWYAAFARAIDGLGDSHHLCGRAAEDTRFPFELRELLFGMGGSPTHRALFTVRPDSVLVLVIRHVAQADVSIDAL